MDIDLLDLQEKLEQLTFLRVNNFFVDLLSLDKALMLPKLLPRKCLLARMALDWNKWTLV